MPTMDSFRLSPHTTTKGIIINFLPLQMTMACGVGSGSATPASTTKSSAFGAAKLRKRENNSSAFSYRYLLLD